MAENLFKDGNDYPDFAEGDLNSTGLIRTEDLISSMKSRNSRRINLAAPKPKINKYTRFIGATHAPVDVYDVLLAFNVTQPAIQHALKKMLAPGQRGVKEEVQDVKEAIQSLERALDQMQYPTSGK